MKNTQAGECPKCGSKNLNYGDNQLEDEQIYYEFVCGDCNTEGKEWYKLTFIESIIDED